MDENRLISSKKVLKPFGLQTCLTSLSYKNKTKILNCNKVKGKNKKGED